MGWYLWTNTENLLDVCKKNDTFYLATPGGLIKTLGDSIVKIYSKVDGINTAEVLSVSCENGLWILTGAGLQYFDNGKFKTLDLIAFENPEEILSGSKIRIRGEYMFILGKTKVMVYRFTDSAEVPINIRFTKPKFLEIFNDSLLIGDTLGFYKVKYDEFYLSAWDTVFMGRPVLSAVKHPNFGWIMGTDSGILDTLGNTLFLPGKIIRFMALRGDTIYLATDSAVYNLSPHSYTPNRIKDGYAGFLSPWFFGIGRINAPYYMFGYGIYEIPSLQKLESRGLPYTTLTGVITLGDSVIVCGRGGANACAVWPSGNTFGFGLTNFVRKHKDKIFFGLNGGGLVITDSLFTDTVIITASQLGGFGYVFDMAVLKDTVYFVSWEPFGNSKVFKLVDTIPYETGIVDYATSILFSTGDRLILCGQSVCKIYYDDLTPYGSISVQANVVYSFGDTLLFGTNKGVEMYSLKTLGYIGKILDNYTITGLWVGMDGRIWASGSMGLSEYDEKNLRIFSPTNSPLPGISVSPSALYPLRFTLFGDVERGRLIILTEKGVAFFEDTSIVSGWWDNLVIYPNPAGKGKTVRIKNCPNGANLYIFTHFGKRVKNVKGCSFKNDLPLGLYVVIVEYNGRRKPLKVVLLDR
ncbi:MAG: T9SS type A sorting domain-containing protein [candidate division WOR-3 bacterium]